VSKTDNIYKNGDFNHLPFSFNEEVTQVFEDMINRSVPGYISSLKMTKEITTKLFQKDSNFYDLGCSIGAVTNQVSDIVRTKKGNILAVDNSEAMINFCKSRIKDSHISFILDDITKIEIENASVASLNFVLQFLEPSVRLNFLKGVFKGLIKGGALLLSEKFSFDSNKEEESVSRIHHSFKLSNGYSELEVSRKRDALEGVLISQSQAENEELLYESGFSEIRKVMKNLNFVTYVAIKL
tara:strand:+ start:2511 stop:3230 length:720 start_codon:yes stop_codon:yes gene_type:complete